MVDDLADVAFSEERNMNNFENELKELINKYSIENSSDTPDFILAEYVMNCLKMYQWATLARDKFYGNVGFKNNPTKEG